VAALASAAASFTASHLWGSGTVLSAALTPVVVALVSEFLRRPVDRVSATAQRVAPIPILPRPPAGGEPPGRRPAPPARGDTQVHQGEWAAASFGEPAAPGWRPRWRLVLLTGVLAFGIVGAFYAVPDLLAGYSVTGVHILTGGSAARTVTVTTPTVSTPTTTQTVTVQTTTVTAPATVTTTTSAPAATTTTPGSSTPTDTTSTPTGATTTTQTNSAPPATP
jgi:hypothetical protein